MITPKEFSEREDIPYPTVMTWLQRGRLPGAIKHETPSGHYYLIPVKATAPALKMGRPKVKKAKGKR